MNPISTITVESALAPATSEPESASSDLFQSLIAELLEPTTAAAVAPSVSQPITLEYEPSVEPRETVFPQTQPSQGPTTGPAIPLLGKGGVDATSREYREASFERSGRGSSFKQPLNRNPRLEPTVTSEPTQKNLPVARTPSGFAVLQHETDFERALPTAPQLSAIAKRHLDQTATNNRRFETTTPSAPAEVASQLFSLRAQPPLLREGGESARPQRDGVNPVIDEFPVEVSSNSDSEPAATSETTPERVVWEVPEREAPKETKPSLPQSFVAFMPPIPDVTFDRTPAIPDIPNERQALPQSAARILFPAMAVTSIKIETEALPEPLSKPTAHLEFARLQRSMELVPTPVNDLPSPPAVTPEPPSQMETPVRDSQVTVAKPEVHTQTAQTLPVQPELTTARQLMQPQPTVITPEATVSVPAVIGASPHLTQNGSQEKQEFCNDNGRAPMQETHPAAPYLETGMRFQSQLMPMESAAPVAHVVELPPQLPLPVAHRVSIDIGEKDSRVVVTLHENRGDVSVKIHAPNEVLGAELRSSVSTLVEAFHREHIPLANMDFTTGYSTTSDDGHQSGNQPRQSFQNRARKFELPTAPTDQVEISSINLNV